MKQVKQILAFGLLMCAAGLSVAANNIVVFSPQAAILRSDAAQNQLKDMREGSEFAGMQAKLETLKADLEALRKEGETKGMTWSKDKMAEHRQKMESVGSDFQYTAKKMQAQQQSVMENIMQGMQPKLEKALMEVVKEVGADLVLDSQSAFYAAPSADITAKVTEKLNKAN